MEQRNIRIVAVGDDLLAGVGDPRTLGWFGRVMARTPQTTASIAAYNLAAPNEGSEQLNARWFEEARVDLLEQLGFGYDRIEEAGYSGPVLEVSCQYKTMSKFGETVRIEASITQYNGVRMTLHYDVYDKATGTLRCTGDSRHCFINAEGKPAILKRCWPEFDAALTANTVKE